MALAFDFLNGLHDAANSIATIVSTRVLAPRYAVAWAAFFNFIAFAVFGSQVANTIGTGIVSPAIVSDAVILAALMAAIIWNIVTWAVGIPSSSSHALIGGLVGAGGLQGRLACDRVERPGQDGGRDRGLALHGVHPGAGDGAGGLLVVRPGFAVQGGQDFPQRAIPLGFRLFAGPWRQ